MSTNTLNLQVLFKSLKVLGRNLLPWLFAVIVAALLGSLLQSTMNFFNVLEMGAYATWQDWLRTVTKDLTTFAPFYGLLVGVAFLLAFPVALWLARKWPRWHTALLCLSGAVGLAVAFVVANKVAAAPTLIAATRSVVGFVAMMSTGAIGAWVFTLTSGKPEYGARKVFSWLYLVFPVVVLVSAFGIHVLMRPDRQVEIDDYPLKNYRVATIGAGLEHPWGMVQLPDGRRLVTERGGKIRIIDHDGALLQQALEGVPDVVIGEQSGLLDIVLSPHFERDKTIFLSYSCGTIKANNLCVGRGELDGVTLKNFRRIFQALPLKDTTLQFGSRIVFLPDDTLVVSIGDGFDFREDAQDLSNHLGKLIRLNRDGSVPHDNPFVGQPGKRPEIYSYGHRNPQGLFYDTESGLLYESEHGPYGGDEINIIEPGVNYGWPIATFGINYPGSNISPHEDHPGVQPPIKHWTPSIAPSGIAVYQGDAFAEFNGDLLVSGLAARGVFRLNLEDGKVVSVQRLFHELDKRIRDVIVGKEGELYLLTDHAPGEILRIEPNRR